MKLWKEFFSKRATIIGIDNFQDFNDNQTPYDEEWLSDGVQFIDADGYTQETVDKIDGGIDILIDDGPHTPSKSPETSGIVSSQDEQGWMCYH